MTSNGGLYFLNDNAPQRDRDMVSNGNLFMCSGSFATVGAIMTSITAIFH